MRLTGAMKRILFINNLLQKQIFNLTIFFALWSDWIWKMGWEWRVSFKLSTPSDSHVSHTSIPLIRAGECSDIIWSGINAGIYEIVRPVSRINDSFSIQILSVKLWELKFQECINVSVSPHRWVPAPKHRVEQAAATLTIKTWSHQNFLSKLLRLWELNDFNLSAEFAETLTTKQPSLKQIGWTVIEICK